MIASSWIVSVVRSQTHEVILMYVLMCTRMYALLGKFHISIYISMSSGVGGGLLFLNTSKVNLSHLSSRISLHLSLMSQSTTSLSIGPNNAR